MSQFLEIILTVIAPIMLIVALGALLGEFFALDRQSLSTVIVYLFSPALVFQSLSSSEVVGSVLIQVTAAIVVTLIILSVAGFGIARVMGLDRRMASAYVLSLIAFNGANYGIPFNEFTFGSEARQYAVIAYVASVVVTNILGVWLASRGSVSGRDALLNAFKVPLIYATIAGLIVNAGSLTVPLPITRSISLLAGATVPAMLVVLGLQLRSTSLRGQIGPVVVAAGGRLILSPLIAVLVTAALGLDGLMRQVTITQLAMPTAVLAGVLAAQFGGEAQFVTASILFSTLASILMLSMLVTLLI
jgi:hypothetical protein